MIDKKSQIGQELSDGSDKKYRCLAQKDASDKRLTNFLDRMAISYKRFSEICDFFVWGQTLRKIETIKTKPVHDFSLDVKLRKLHVAIVCL